MNTGIEPVPPPTPKPALKRLPPFWWGFLFVGLWYLGLFLEEPQIDDESWTFWVAFLGGYLFWLFCIHRLHLVLRQLTGNQYPISPGWAVLLHLVPLVNIWWLFEWPREFTNFIRTNGPVKIVSGILIGLSLLITFPIGKFLYSGIGLVLLFGPGLYLRNVLGKQIEYMYTSPGEGGDKPITQEP